MTTRIGAKGQVVIPKALRDRLSLHAGDAVDISLDGESIVITAKRTSLELGGRYAGSGMAARLLDDRANEPR
jgi:AbrB family looped-hinge helix DNA binding protein